jgi:hypothetical protein
MGVGAMLLAMLSEAPQGLLVPEVRADPSRQCARTGRT